jgi:hypothetical protein
MRSEIKSVCLERRAKLKLDVLSDWIDYRNAKGQRLDGTDLLIFSYIDRIDKSRSPKVEAHRDAGGRPWIDLGTLSLSMPLIRLKAQAIADRVSKMNDMQLVDAKTHNVVVPGVGPRNELHAFPSLRYRSLEEQYEEDEGKRAADRYAGRKGSRARNV